MYNQFKHFFEQPFSSAHDFLTQIAKPIFGKKNITPHNDTLQNYQTEIENAGLKKVVVVAEIAIGGNPIRVYDVTVGSQTNLEHARVGIKRALISFTDVFMHAFVLFHYENSDNREWRFSYFYKQTNNTEVTAARRYTYLVGQGNNCRTIAEQLNNLVTQDKTDKTITDTFGVQALSDDFFRRFTDQYKKFVTEITGTEFKDGVEVAKRDAEPAEYFHSAFEGDSKAVRDFVKKMQGRIVFLHFLQKKGWLGDGKPNYLKSLFDEQPDDIQADFLEQILKPLFFGVLNKKGKKEQGENNDRKKYFTEGKLDEQYNRCTKEHLAKLYIKWEDAPYLNGGLFDPDTLDIKDVKFKTETWQDFFDTLAEYNFTIDENDPDDMEVGVDPEMLGRIFESQLEDNKAKGAFYTPKEIVQYMCAESLIAYLEASLPSIANLAAFVKNPHAEYHFTETERNAILEKLRAVKICDPAIGSGAFPMGMLNLLYNCRRALGDAERNPQGHTIRRQIVEQNIYGVDIERGAVDIARLRFWLALIVEETEPEPLPNFDYKFMQGNSLLESFQGVDLSQLVARKKVERRDQGLEVTLFENNVDLVRKELHDKITHYFNCTDHTQKALLAQQITDNINAQMQELALPPFPKDLDLKANTQFFLWHTWFADVFQNGGFDIVIGNPPYVLISSDNKHMQDYKKFYQLAKCGKVNLYRLFFELSLNLLHEKGTLAFITPNTYLTDSHGEKLREILFNTKIIEIVEYTESDRVFENVAQAVATIICNKKACEKNYLTIRTSKQGKHTFLQSDVFSQKKVFIPLSKTILQIGKQKNKLGDYFDIYQGEINLTAKRDFFSEIKQLNSLPMWRGANVGKYVNVSNPIEYCRIEGSNRTHYKKSRIVLQQVSNQSQAFRTKAFLSPKDYICGNSTNYLVEKENNTISLLFWLGIVNSKVFNYYFNYFSYTNHLTATELESIPIPLATPSQQRPIISLVEKILAAKRANPQADTAALEREIDELVYELYGLSAEEVKVVEA